MRSIKKDFAPALLHAENLSWILSDAATAEELLSQSQSHDERKVTLDNFLDIAEPRSVDKLYRIKHTGQRLLTILRSQSK